ncbi:5'-nucleotidase C-terminal domain-containing protein [Flavobacteriaceae bacterium XHP0103]|uniref:5'-nucleotidase n=1 Tax=Marixanthotalea marina TaxID=2844359 RepID=UPI002989A976|nr:5'-nucleotidase [Marixanthotalea marina]MBU3822562.1 5'-nucleotidase C-terminal domain-containing protein [Marixanthotalea marina]
MDSRLLILLFLSALTIGCKEKQLHLSKIEGRQISISDSLKANTEINDFIEPYRKHIQADLSTVLAYAVDTYSKTDGEFNTAIGNFMADAVYEEANPIFLSRTNKNIDMVLLNHGGIRAIISKGDITTRTAFELMPFENSIVVVALKGSQVTTLINYLSKAKKAHPISKLKLSIDNDDNIIEATINNKPIDQNKTYYIATNDYLYNGGDNMTFFQPNDSLYVLDYKIRNALIDHFKKVDTISPVRDNRFIQIK